MKLSFDAMNSLMASSMSCGRRCPKQRDDYEPIRQTMKINVDTKPLVFPNIFFLAASFDVMLRDQMLVFGSHNERVVPMNLILLYHKWDRSYKI